MEHSLHSHQHAYQTDRSVETALHSLLCKTERALKDGLITLGHQGCADNTAFESMCKVAEEYGEE
jgi:hypothetical protein